jgi:hypothetical protein
MASEALRWGVFVLGFGLWSCGNTAAPAQGPWQAIPGARCNARTRSYPTLDSPHLQPDASAPRYNSNPPSSGPHEGRWARWGAHTGAIPRENYVHNLEHGGVLLAWRCPDGSCSTARELLAALGTFPNDPACDLPGVPPRPRVLATPDPLLESTVAAAGWGRVYQADCVDAESLRGFYLSALARAPEDTCAEGSVP